VNVGGSAEHSKKPRAFGSAIRTLKLIHLPSATNAGGGQAALHRRRDFVAIHDTTTAGTRLPAEAVNFLSKRGRKARTVASRRRRAEWEDVTNWAASRRFRGAVPAADRIESLRAATRTRSRQCFLYRRAAHAEIGLFNPATVTRRTRLQPALPRRWRSASPRPLAYYHADERREASSKTRDGGIRVHGGSSTSG
jgi:hypothetical protein